jgi:pSer/pThr/pTyr-binding forkhead associated (FHA) protein
MVFEVPAMRSPSAILRAIGPDGREHDVRIDGTLLTIGRAADNGFAIDDAKVSRHHARLRARHGMLVLTDLDSTNGVRVNGVRAAEVALGVGDRIEIGDTVLVVEAVSAD